MKQSRSDFPRRQSGATLIVALIVLILVLMLGIGSISTSNTQVQLAGNLQFADGAMNNAETAISSAEQWLSSSTNFQDAGFSVRNAATTPHLWTKTDTVNPLTMTWSDSNSLKVAGNDAQRYYIQQLSKNNVLFGSSLAVGKQKSSVCNQVNTYLITARGASARGATKYVQDYYSVLSC